MLNPSSRPWPAVLSLGLILAPQVAAQPVAEAGQVVVLSPTVTIQSGAIAVATVTQGERYPYSQRNGDWYWIEIRQGGATKKGWIHKQHVRVEAAPVSNELERLQGTWVCVATHNDGQLASNYVGVKAELRGDQLTWHYLNPDGSYRTEVCRFRVDASQQPPHFDWWREAKPDAVEQRVYSLHDGLLRMGTNLDYSTRPASLEAARWQFTLRPVVAADGAEIATQFPAWGTAIDPTGRCTIRSAGDKLSIGLPPGLFDHWYGEEDPACRANAPRVVRDVTGDFTVQVKVTADWSVGPPMKNGRFSRVAGLLVSASDNHYFRHERNEFQQLRNPGVMVFWTPPLYDRDGARISTWKAGNADIFGGRSTWLRLVRKGSTITAGMSRNGRAWEQTAVLETTFPEKVSVGVLAHQASNGEWVCEFEEFRLEGAAGAAQ